MRNRFLVCLFLSVVLPLVVVLVLSAKVVPEISGATVQRRGNVCVFVFCTPVSEYVVLGTAKVSGFVSNTKPDHMIDLLVKVAKKNYPDAQGVLISDVNNFERADVV